MSTMTAARLKIKPTRRTARPDAPFGAGLTRFVPFAVLAPGFVEPSDEDRAAVGPLFAGGADWDARAWSDAHGTHCEMCDRPVERGELVGGLCSACQDAAEEAMMTCQYGAVGLGWRSY